MRLLGRHRGLIVAVCLVLIAGTAALMVSLIPVLNMLANPAQGGGHELFSVQLDNQAPNSPYAQEGEPPSMVSFRDAMALRAGWPQSSQVVMYPGAVVVAGSGSAEFEQQARVTSADFFGLFQPPFRYGGGWDSDQDDGAFVVLSARLNQILFDGKNSVGQFINVDGASLKIVGVLADWLPMPRYFDLRNGRFSPPEDLYLPFEWGLKSGVLRSGSRDCWPPYNDGESGLLESECIWLNFWVRLESPTEVARYREFLDAYVTSQMALGRFPKGLNNRLRAVPEWLRSQPIVPTQAKLQLLLASLLFLLCVLNACVLMGAFAAAVMKDHSIHQMLGASHWQMWAHHGWLVILITIVVAVGAWFVTLCGLFIQQRFVQELQYIVVPSAASLALVLGVCFASVLLANSLPRLLIKPNSVR